MKKIKKLLFIFLLLGVVFCFSDVYAKDPYVYIGTHKITSGYDDDLYGGHVKLTDTELVLDGVSINETYLETSTYIKNNHSVYIHDMVLDIKLVGENNFKSVGVGNPCYKVNPDDDRNTLNNYVGIFINSLEDEKVTIYGSGILNIDVDNYCVAYGIYYDEGFINIGLDNNHIGPTLNINLKNVIAESFAMLIIKDIYNSNININISTIDLAESCYGIWFVSESIVKNSNINIDCNISSSSFFAMLFSEESDSVTFKDTNLKLSGNYKDTNSYLPCIYQNAFYFEENSFEDCNIYVDVPFIISIDPLNIKRTNNKNVDIFLSGKFYYYDEDEEDEYMMSFTFDNITNDMIYTSTTTRDALSNSTPFSQDNIANYKYIHIKSSNNYEVLSGNNQKIDGNEFTFKLNGPKIFLTGLYLDDVLLDESDYNYDYDGTVSLTSPGLNKIKDLNNGSHKIQARYVNDKTVDIDFEIGEGSTLNPDTIDYVLIYFFSLFVSIVCIFTVLKVIRKKRI